MKPIAIFFLSLMILCVFVGVSVAENASTSAISLGMDSPLPVSPDFSENKLENGLTYYIRKNIEPENRARLMLVVKAGRLQEEDGQLGAAHFVEHMAFNGTRNFPGKEIDRFMESVGMGTCECYSGYTTYTKTVYSFWLPTDNMENLDRGLLALSDIASEISLDPDEVERERGVIIEEWRQSKGRAQENTNKIFELIYEGSRYAERLPSNEKSFAEDLSIEAIAEFYHQWYRPDLMAVIVVGDFDAEAVDSLVRKHFSHLISAKDAPEWKEYDVPEKKDTQYLVVTDPDTYTFSLSASTLHEGGEHATVGDFRRSLARLMFIDMLNYRFSSRLLEKDSPYLSAGVSYGSSVGSKYLFSLAVSSEEGGLRRALDAAIYESGRVLQHGFTSPELERNKTALLKTADEVEAKGYKSSSSTLAAELMRHFLNGEPVPGDRNEVLLVRGVVPLITIEEVNAFGREFIAFDKGIVLAKAPAGKESQVPGKDDIVALLAGAGAIPVEEYVDIVRDDELIPVPPSPGEIVSSNKVERFDYLEWKLSNGATVVLKPTEFEKSEILFSAYSSGGNSLARDDDYPTAILSVPIVIGGGLGNFDAISLEKKLSDKSVTLIPFITELDEGFLGSSTPEDLETLFQLLYLYFTAPRKDEVVFDVLKKRLSLAVSVADQQPGKVLRDALTETLYNNHPRRISLDKDKVASIDLDKALDFYKDRFSGASDFTFFLVGSFSPDNIRHLVERYIGGLPATNRQETWRDVGVELPRGNIRREVRSGTGEKATVALIFTGSLEWDRRKDIELQIMGQALHNMLTESMREDMSATYGVNVSSSTQRYPRPSYSLTVTFNCSPDNVESLTQAVFAGIRRLKEGNDTERYVLPVIKKQLTALDNRQRENDFWLELLSYMYVNHIPLGEYELTKEILEKLTPEDVTALSKKYFDFENYINLVYYSGT